MGEPCRHCHDRRGRSPGRRHTAAPARTCAARCRHCGRANPNRPKGLCWTCYYRPGVREQYAPVSPHGRRSKPDVNGAVPPAPAPTSALPGTPAKVAVLIERAAQGVSLWHPEDGIGLGVGGRHGGEARTSAAG